MKQYSITAVLLPSVFTAAIFILIIFGLNQTEKSSNAEDFKALEDNLRRAVITCYAVEGSYPESISYMEKNYGVKINKNKYSVHYEIFASNMLPDITVICIK